MIISTNGGIDERNGYEARLILRDFSERSDTTFGSGQSPVAIQEPSLDLVRQIDAVLEATGDTEAHHLLDQIIALEAYLNEPHALFSGERDTEGIDVAEYPFG